MVKITGIHATYFIVRISHKYAIEKPGTKNGSHSILEQLLKNPQKYFNNQFSKKWS